MPDGTLELQRLGGEVGERHFPVLAEWILDAGNPHLQWLSLDDRGHALGVIAASLASVRSELWAGHVTALIEGGEAIGGFVALPSDDLPDRRKADLTQLIRATDREQRAELRRRVELGKTAYLPVEPRQLFLSKFGLLASHRGRGLGSSLLDAFIASAWLEGFNTIRLDVNRANTPAVRLYESRGFRPIGRTTLAVVGVEYLAMILERDGHA